MSLISPFYVGGLQHDKAAGYTPDQGCQISVLTDGFLTKFSDIYLE